jgi:glycosyltransferase involved in cell wall biosynthesis
MTRFALVHDWFDCVAGSEKVVGEMLHCFPQSDVFSLVDYLTAAERRGLGIDAVQTSFIQKLPFARKRFRHYLPLMPAAIERFDLSTYDVILSSSHAVAKGVITNAQQLHISYIHTPIRYAWDMYHEYLRQSGLTRGPKAAFVKAVLHYIRMWDRVTADRPDVYVANSNYVADRIRKTYGRDARVIYPPVNVHRWETHRKKENFFLAAGRLVPYKRFDLLVDAFAQLPEQRLIIIGDGPEYKKLKAAATKNVEMLGYLDDESLFDYMKRASAFVFGAVEDFGIMPVEAQACGTPVIGMNLGGVAETVIHGETGLLFDEQTPECVAETVHTFCELPAGFLDPCRIRANAERFSVDRFRRKFAELVNSAMRSRRDTQAAMGSRRDTQAAVPIHVATALPSASYHG